MLCVQAEIIELETLCGSLSSSAELTQDSLNSSPCGSIGNSTDSVQEEEEEEVHTLELGSFPFTELTQDSLNSSLCNSTENTTDSVQEDHFFILEGFEEFSEFWAHYETTRKNTVAEAEAEEPHTQTRKRKFCSLETEYEEELSFKK